MLKNTIVPVPFLKDRKRLLQLEFIESPVNSSQRRFTDRHLLKPVLDLADYRCEAVIDWVELEFHLGRKTQFRHLKKEIDRVCGRTSYVEPVEAGSGGVSDVFRVIFQDPHIVDLVRVTDAIGVEFGLISEPRTVGLEVSVDFYSKRASEIEGLAMVAVLARHLFPNKDIIERSADHPRFAWGKGKAHSSKVWGRSFEGKRRWAILEVEADRTIPVDATFYLGEEGSPAMWRVMNKLLDRQNPTTGTRTVLPVEGRRARVEVTLRGEELQRTGTDTLAGLKEVNLTKFQRRYFQFVLPTFILPKDPVGVDLFRERRRVLRFLNIGAVGLAALDAERQRNLRSIDKNLKERGYQVPPRGRRKENTTKAYEALNEKVREALRNLQRRELGR
ncbi:hypothetical protein [Devosia sp.]|uniref:hypothetical protein n=1 Tax=Devosia sp. TaxID=1871048 RepID=UPI0025CC49D0|nr:hypothetical protein [Devosia sp.]MCR6637108.1 hypothetical protein [Devosia sp.]